ncbi:signal-induced proliferation-associated 1-like protein 1 isoform X1 [Photinus pyralis]|uniref:signal-induced proliferation-associated 1-like protein 1 isoform X1 n=1 Tax=Photinus pyralis TaxID=7054 RepID=UPI001266FC84|nr:signal-induced proliferation-associated 1-like protein 1 isoform X1 [Photinus pyralis]
MIGLEECGPAPPRAPPSSNRARERTAQAVDYYNTHLQRARVNAGLSAPRSSYNDRHHHHNVIPKRQHLSPDLLYRSNSSLELVDHHVRPSNTSSPTLKREYGSHGSIDIIDRPAPISGTSESFFAMLQDYRPTVLGANGTDQRSPGPSEYLRGKVDAENSSNSLISDDTLNSHPQSPKLRVKLPKFWGSGSVSGSSLKSQRQAMDDSVVSSSTINSSISLPTDSDEIQRRRAFVHYDCQSLTTNLSYSVRIRKNLLSKRRNTTTGASAASMIARSSTPDGENGDEDSGDGHSNDLVENCPFFRNEVGGEEERVVSLTRVQNGQQNPNRRRPLHRPPLAYGVAVLEFPNGETHWRHSTCPYQRLPRPIESVDQGALYYRKYFLGQDHQNWFGMDEQLGPVALSIRREKVTHQDNHANPLMQHQYRLIIRTSELLTLRGAILEDAIPNIKQSSGKTMSVKEVLEYVSPEIQINCLRLGNQSQQQMEEQLLKLDEQGLTSNYKVGVMYCRAGQSSEEEMYNNEDAGPAFQEFLDTIGKKVRLKGFDKYKAGLDNKSDSTGLYSIYSQYQDCEIMFHVSTMLPFTPNNRQQLLRKRHIGNDIVTIVFQEPGALPFTPKNIRSQFQHVFIVVRAINPCTENTHYTVAVSRSKDVQVFGPPIKDGAVFPKGKAFADFLLAKVVNAENAAHRSEKFVTMATRTRQEYLKDLVSNFSSTTPVDTGQKFCKLTVPGYFYRNSFILAIFSSKKKDKIRPRFIPDACQRGAILWQVMLDDSGQSQQIECLLGISTDTLALIEEQSRQIVFVTPCKSVLGWSPQTSSLRIYHHQGECMTIHMRDAHYDRDELMEIMERLKAVTPGVLVQELSLKRNIMGQLGFHVQPDGIVTLVESAGQAWQAGLRQNSRLVEICKVAVSTLTYDQMVDLLKTSMLVTLTVIPPMSDGSPRKGCALQNCKYNEGNYESDYENGNTDDSKNRKAAQLQQAVPGNHKKIYERSFSPPRSSSSSGYGTGSSSKSFLGNDSRFASNPEGTMTSSSSGHSDDRWYEFIQENLDLEMGIPPPLPVKSTQNRPHQSNNTYPSTPKRNNIHQIAHLQISQSHNHFGPQNLQHTKIQVSHSLPLQHANYSTPLTAALHNSTYDYEMNYKMDKNNLLKQENDRRMRQETEYVVTRAPKVAEYTTLQQLNSDMVRNNLLMNDGHSTDSSVSDRLYGIGSEDELSTGSGGNVSPRTKRSTKLANLSNNNSRNQSPRSLNGEAKLRPGVTSRSSNRNSANLATSTFQEELIRLIDPDSIEESREPIRLNKENKSEPEVILTMARPATVISNSSTTSSPLPAEFKIAKDERLSPRVTSTPSKRAIVVGPEALPLPGDMDWPSLVDTATRVMMQVAETSSLGSDDKGKHWQDDQSMDASINSVISSSASVPELQNHVCELETRVSEETRRRLSLEDEVRRLKDENRKLHDQAQAAVSQLRKFTEWFFKNVQRQ